MKRLRHFARFPDSDVARQIRAQRRGKFCNRNCAVRLKARYIARRVHACVRPAASVQNRPLARNGIYRVRQPRLHTVGVALHLPAVITRADIGKAQCNVSHIAPPFKKN